MTNIDFSPKPYRVERRAYIGQPWMLVGEDDSHSLALKRARKSVQQYEGFARVIVQHVIERYDRADAVRDARERKRRGSRKAQA